MKLIQQTTLHYQEESSDKLYEVDLCEVDSDGYVVNFRYGRRGKKLKESSKTVNPVPLAQAQDIFDKLVVEKIKKGYQDITSPVVKSEPPRSVEFNPRDQAILNCLAGSADSSWSLERAIWRAGELKLRDAAPKLLNLIGTGTALRDYCIAWALGWCGHESAINTLESLLNDASTTDAVRRIAFEALLKLSDEETRTRLQVQKIEQLPLQLREVARNGPADVFALALRDYLASDSPERFAVLDTLYLIDNDEVRPALLEILRTAPLKFNYFQRFRHIFKAAEYRLDAEVFGIIAYRFEKEPGESFRCYSSTTRDYLRQRVWRTLRRLGQLGDSNYVKMAVGVLLPFSDSDAVPVQRSTNVTRRTWDTYAGYLAFNYILYSNSPRYYLKPNNQAWRCRNPYKPGDPEPRVREEAFPEIWEQNPTDLLHLLKQSNCWLVHHFAVKALRACQTARLDVAEVVMLLGRPYAVTAQLGFELARGCYQSGSPNPQLVLAVANCLLPEARTEAHHWIEEQWEKFVDDSNFIVALVTSQYPENRQLARRLLGSSSLSHRTTSVVMRQLIAEMLALEPQQLDLIQDIVQILETCFVSQLHTLDIKVVRDLLSHPLSEIQDLGVTILSNYSAVAAELTPEMVSIILGSPHKSLREKSIQLFEQLPNQQREQFLADYQFLATLVTSQYPENRQLARRLLGSSSLSHRTTLVVMRQLIAQMLALEPQQSDLIQEIVQILEACFVSQLHTLDIKVVRDLLSHPLSEIQDLGVTILSNYSAVAAELTPEMVSIILGSPHKSLREKGIQLFEQLPNQQREQFLADCQFLVTLVTSQYADNRQLARHLPIRFG